MPGNDQLCGAMYPKNLGARKFILGTVIEVGWVYHETGNKSLLANGYDSTYSRTLAGEIEPKFEAL